MNPRIKLVNNREVRILADGKRDKQQWIKCGPTGGLAAVPAGFYDDLGRDALIEVLQCLKHTGSFAALSDESAVPFLEKEMRIKGFENTWIYYCDGGTANTRHLMISNANGERRFVRTINLLPLVEPKPPEPTVRPWSTIEEVWPYLRDGGQWAVTQSGHRHRLCSVRPQLVPPNDHIFTIGCCSESPDGKWWFDISPELIVKWKLESTGEYCGVVVEQEKKL